MRSVVLAKIVPDRASIAVDRSTSRVERPAGRLFINPFDQRSLRRALDLRRPGDEVVVVAMGPPQALEPLSTLLPLGADRVLLLSDPALAGADLLGTALALSGPLGDLRPSLVMAGVRSTDSGTAALPAELAELLGLRLYGPARRIERPEESDRLRLTVDTRRGWAVEEAELPALVTCGEKVATLRPASEAERSAAAGRSVERLPFTLGPAGRPSTMLGPSETRLVAIRSDALERRRRRVDEGSPIQRLTVAFEAIERLRAERPSERSPYSTGPPSGGEPWIWRIAPPLPEGGERSPGAPTCDGAAELVGVHRLEVVVGADHSATREGSSTTPPRGADRVEIGEISSARGLTDALEGLLAERPAPVAIVAGASALEREAMARLAARRRLGLITDVRAASWSPEGEPLWEKSSFGDRASALVVARRSPALVTLHPDLRPPDPRPGPFDHPSAVGAVDELEGYADLEGARLVLSLGRGVGSAESVRAIAELARRAGAAVGGSRKIVDLGWLPNALQIGLTGRSIAPELALLAGVRGAANHLVGLRRARVIVAIDPDPAAPVLEEADVGLVGRWEELLPGLLERLAA